jgi:hypothetical protein
LAADADLSGVVEVRSPPELRLSLAWLEAVGYK